MSISPPSATRRLLIVYHSRTGGTLQMAQSAQAGAQQQAGVQVDCRSAEQVSAEDVLAADGYVFASPEYLGAASGVMKDFFDRCYYDVLDQVAGRPYALLVCAGSDGQGAIRQITRIVTGWRLRAVAEPLCLCTHAQTPQTICAPKQLSEAQRTACRELGEALAGGLALGIF